MMESSVPCSLVELSISCRNLTNADYLSKSDPCCIVSIKNGQAANSWTEIDRTEVVNDNLNPEFAKKIKMTYLFEERQLLKFDVYDADSQSSNLSDHDYLGGAVVALGEIVSSCNLMSFERPLIIPKKANEGIIKIFAEEIQSSKEKISIKFAAQNLVSSFFGGSYDYFFEVHKTLENNRVTLVYRSPVISGKKSVEWDPFQISCITLCNCDFDKSVTFTLYKHKSNGSHESLGVWNTTVCNLLNGQSSCKLPSGIVLQMLSICKDSYSSFMDYVRIGVQLHCFIGVDFTASNGVPTVPSSLHFISPNRYNQYQLALKSVLDIIQDYDSDKMFPALGFGAQIPPNWAVSHEFFMNFNPSSPYCQGVEGVMNAYANTVRSVRLYGPTNFAPIINHVSRFASVHNDGKNYFILLIITDGVISDMAETTQAIVDASFLPVSIIIVGVGETDFSAMNVLDGDDQPLVDAKGRKMERDIVQFVPFSKISRKAGNDYAVAQYELAREVLAEIPQQFLSYMRKMGKTPEQLGPTISR